MTSIEKVCAMNSITPRPSAGHFWTFAIPLIERISADGAYFLIKADGEREAGTYTVLVSGGPLGQDFIRRETDELENGTIEVIEQYAADYWS